MLAFLYYEISLLELFLKHEEGLYLLRWMDVYNISLSSQMRKCRLVSRIVSVSYCCITNHPKSFSAFKQQSCIYSWFGLAIWAGLCWDSSSLLYVVVAGLAHIWGRNKGAGTGHPGGGLVRLFAQQRHSKRVVAAEKANLAALAQNPHELISLFPLVITNCGATSESRSEGVKG